MVIKEATSSEIMASNAVDTNKPSEKTLIITQEIKFARALAGNDSKLRTKVLKNLKTWLSTRSQSTFAFSDADFLRLWKGLFYCMWMSDKPLVQEELAESVGTLVRCFEQNVPVALQFFKAFMVTMGIEWFGIDRWRMDKFMMFVRRVTRQMLFVMHENDWQTEDMALLAQIIETTVLNHEVCPFGLMNHFNDLLLEEVAKVSDGEVPKEIITHITEPYVRYLLKNDDTTINSSIVKSIFHALMHQSDLGQMYEEKFDIWKRANFVTGDIDNVEFNVEYQYEDDEEGAVDGEEDDADADDEANQEEEDENEETEEVKVDNEDDGHEDEDEGEEDLGTEKVYDPRAGRVSVEIPQIEFDPLEIISLFEKYRYKPYVTSKGKKSANLLVRQLNKFCNGVFPLGVKHVPSIDPKDYQVDIDEQVQDLDNFRKNLCGEKRKSLKELKKEKQRQRIILREQKEARAKRAAEMALNGSATAEQAETLNATETARPDGSNEQNELDAAGPVEKMSTTSKKKAKQRRQSPAVLKKQMKLELLKKKKQEKLILLKERLQKNKTTTVLTNGSTVLAKGEEPSPTTIATESEVKQSKPETKKAEAAPSAKKQQTKNKKREKKDTASFETVDEWSKPMEEGEEEYFIPSRKLKSLPKLGVSSAPVKVSPAKSSLKRTPSSPVTVSFTDADSVTPARKRVKIALNKNVAQDLVEHIKNVKSSPQLPFDSNKKPSKSLLKPNLIPSPINPFYKKKIGLK